MKQLAYRFMCKSGSQAGPCKRNTVFSEFFLCLDFPKFKKDFQEDVEEIHQNNSWLL